MEGSLKAKTYEYEEGWVLNDAAPEGSFEAKAPYIDNGTDLLAPERYYDPAFMKREWDGLWTKTWLLAGRVDDIPEPGDFFRFDIGTESFLVMRGTKGDIRVMFNVCQHRGARLVGAEFGSFNQIRCPYHSWAWTIDGEITHVTDRETFRPEVLEGSLDLSRVRHAVWG
ncbi:MAG: Rieske (2Fe-2S) protein, partial [Novosphingobium sp.]